MAIVNYYYYLSILLLYVAVFMHSAAHVNEESLKFIKLVLETTDDIDRCTFSPITAFPRGPRVQTGPYSNCKRIYSHFSSTARPSPQKVEEYMSDLKAAQLGTIKKAGRMTVFYKELPSVLQHREHELGNFNIAINEYKEQFLASDDLLTSLQKQSMLENHPQANDIKAYFRDQTVDLDD